MIDGGRKKNKLCFVLWQWPSNFKNDFEREMINIGNNDPSATMVSMKPFHPLTYKGFHVAKLGL